MPPPDAPTSIPAAGSKAGPRTNPVADVLASVMGYFSNRDDMAPQNEIVTYVTAAYLDQIAPTDPPTPRVLEKELLAIVNGVCKSENFKAATTTEKLPLLRCLTYWQVAQILLRLHHVIRIAPNAKDTDREYDLLAMYQATGRARGTYTTSEDDIRTTVRMYNTQLTLKEFTEVLAVLREDSPRRHQSTNRDFIAARNGIVFYGTEPLDVTIFGRDFQFEPKQVHPFDPGIVLLTKNDVDYVDDAPQQVITHPEDGDWEVVTWIEELFDQPGDEGLADLIWEVIGAIIRPHVRWGKTAWFYSEQGNNGKGTLYALMRNLVGSGAHASIPLSDFGKDFALEPLVRANAIIVDENDVGTFIDKAANLKAIVTNDVIQINRKYRMPIAYQFFGFMVQCLNEFPRVKDKSESFYRRQLFVPFTKSFTGAEKKYIKDDYLQRREVLEYVFWYAINRAGVRLHGPGLGIIQMTLSWMIWASLSAALALKLSPATPVATTRARIPTPITAVTLRRIRRVLSSGPRAWTRSRWRIVQPAKRSSSSVPVTFLRVFGAAGFSSGIGPASWSGPVLSDSSWTVVTEHTPRSTLLT